MCKRGAVLPFEALACALEVSELYVLSSASFFCNPNSCISILVNGNGVTLILEELCLFSNAKSIYSPEVISTFSVTVKVTPCSGEPFWWLTTVYGPRQESTVLELQDRIKLDIKLWIEAGASRLGCLKRE
jgi:hypothetical protein